MLLCLQPAASGKLYSFGCGGDGQLGHGDSEVRTACNTEQTFRSSVGRV